jgi:hypothetical protein
VPANELDGGGFVDADLVAAINGAPPGPMLIRCPARSGNVLAQLIDVVCREGFLLFDLRHPTRHGVGSGVPLHCHVALVVRRPADRLVASATIKRLAAASPRRHLVIWAR